jgi:hypothetical protein
VAAEDALFSSESKPTSVLPSTRDHEDPARNSLPIHKEHSFLAAEAKAKAIREFFLGTGTHFISRE